MRARFSNRRPAAAASEEPAAAAQPTSQKQSEPYGLGDEDYLEWKKALSTVAQSPSSVEPLKSLAQRPKLLNYRSPVTKRTLLEEMACQGAKSEVLQEAEALGCVPVSEEVSAKLRQKQAKQATGGLAGDSSDSGDYLGLPRQRSANMVRAPPMASRTRERKAALGARRAVQSLQTPVPELQQQQQQAPEWCAPFSNAAPQALAAPAAAAPSSLASRLFSAASSSASAMPSMAGGPSKQRKSGYKMAMNERTQVPRSRLNADIVLEEEEDLDRDALQQKLEQVYCGTARVQIDEVEDRPAGQCSKQKRAQAVKYRVMFDKEEEAKTWAAPENQGANLASRVASAFGMSSSAVNADAPIEVDTVDAVTLKLDSDSSHILCGACLMYSSDGCEKVVCYCDRTSVGGGVRHSGDTQVDGKSVHTIQLVYSKIPLNVNQLYFTLCSCGPADLSGFKDPSIMLYQNSEPDANLLEYSINQAKNSVSSVMARMVRKPLWSADERVLVRCALRRMRLPFVCIDLCMAMAADSNWDIEALGTTEWNLKPKICQNYQPAKDLIETNRRAEQAKAAAKDGAASTGGCVAS